MQARCRIAFLLFFLPFLVIGCRSNTNKLESELRTRDQLYRDALEEQRRMEANNIALRHELDAVRQGGPVGPTGPASGFGVKRIALGRGTGGLDLDSTPGDELLQVVVEPRDGEDHAFKAPGTLHIFALEVTQQGIKNPLCLWEIPPDKLHASWKSGLLSTGYTLTMPWKALPIYENVRIVVRFVTPDQRSFEADRDIKVRVVPGALQKRPEIVPGPPIYEMGPILMPTGKSTSSWMRAPEEPSTPTRTQWRADPPSAPGGTITIGQPMPLD
jgi:hypothetical protein